MHLQPIDRTDLAQAWAVAESWLAQACRRPGCDLTPADLRAAIERDEAALILIVDRERPVAAGVTQVRDLAGGDRSCHVLAVGGTGARAWRETLRQIEAGAARNGCARVEFVGRVGWAALLPDYAVDAHYVKHLEQAR